MLRFILVVAIMLGEDAEANLVERRLRQRCQRLRLSSALADSTRSRSCRLLVGRAIGVGKG